ncbi:MAG TPA: alpha/beta hydrolase [Kofleriaceae bacterium]|jgi:pimeloyl-ACP methyl ester carboxylesterase|nr:alpha/beta hydrolase [Kofleriaceae bacterium]
MSRFIESNGIRMHLVEQGSGPLVVLLHGFPELSSTWRHQLSALAAAGYHAVAPDQRGYGQTDCPEREDAYTIFHLVGDVIGLIDALGERQAVVVGHDWGAPVAWNAALLRPDRVRAVVGMSVPPRDRPAQRPTELMRRRFGDSYYQLRFQEPGLAEQDFGPDVRAKLRTLIHAASGDAPPAQRWQPTAPGPFLAGLSDPGRAPAWLGEDQLDALTAAFTRTGARGGLSWYRNIDRNWELSAPLAGLAIHSPSMLVMGDADPGFPAAVPMIDAISKIAPGLRRSLVLPGAGHWIGEERPAEVNAALLEFLAGL